MWWTTQFLLVLMMIINDVRGEMKKCYFQESIPARMNFTNREGNVIPITLEIADWRPQRILSYALRMILDEVFGYDNIKMLEIGSPFDYKSTFTRIQNNESTINMEVWVPTWISEIEVNRSLVDSLSGKLGYSSCHVPPRYSMYNDWAMFQNPKFATLFPQDSAVMSIIEDFKTNTELTPNGTYIPERCRTAGARCTIMLTCAVELKYIVSQINDMQLYIQLYCVGQNLERVSTLLYQSNSQMFYIVRMWYPSDISMDLQVWRSIGKYNSVKSKYVGGKSYELMKLGWSELYYIAPKLYDILGDTHAFDYYDQLHLHGLNNMSEYEIACEWLQNGFDPIWLDDPEQTLKVIVVLPTEDELGQNESFLRVIKHVGKVANRAQNKEKYRFAFGIHYVSKYKDTDSVTPFLDFPGTNTLRLGIVGPAWISQVGITAEKSNSTNVMVISYSADAEDFDNREKYKFLFRTIGSNNPANYIYSTFLKHYNWDRAAILHTDDSSAKMLDLKTMLRDHNIIGVSTFKIPTTQNMDRVNKFLSILLEDKMKIVIVDVTLMSTFAVICAAYNLNMTAEQGYVWFLPEWLPDYWWRANKSGVSPCTSDNLFKVINGHFRIQQTYFGPDDQPMDEDSMITKSRTFSKKLLSKRAGFLYDACLTYVHAFKRFVIEYPDDPSGFTTDTGVLKFRDVIARSDFLGLSGRVRFNGGSSRVMNYTMEQFVNTTYRTVANYYPNASDLGSSIEGGKFIMNGSAIQWLSGSIPDDGHAPPSQCVFKHLAESLNISCEIAIVIVFLIIFILLGIFSGIGFFIFKRRYDRRVRIHKEFMRAQGVLRSDDCGWDEWEVPRNKVVLNRKIGEGAFGMVYGGEALLCDQDWCPVAVKTLKVGSSNENKCDFLSEVEVMKRFEHPNIIKLLGVCIQSEPVLTIMEFMLYGDLRTYLLARRHLVKNPSNESSDEIGNKRLTGMALDVARALSYLRQLKYVHRDVASRNCLVNAERVVKLGDFGMTRSIYDNDYYRFCRKGKFPIRWMAPESLESGLYTFSSDIWSFGVLLFEIITFGRTPYEGMTNEQVFKHVKSGNTFSISSDVKPTLKDLMSSCLVMDQSKRISPLEISSVLVSNPCLLEPCLHVPSSMPTELLDFGLTEERWDNPPLIANDLQTDTSNALLTDESINLIVPNEPGIELIETLNEGADYPYENFNQRNP